MAEIKNVSMTEDEIIAELEATLSAEPNNYSKILDLSTRLAKHDKQNVRFTVDAGVIDRLGTELVARQETAVSELVKNSYDADAKEVTLTFSDSDVVGGTLRIDDDGIGMNRSQLVDGFMRISSTDKLHNPVSEKFLRKRSGQKGIGRFAVQRLGSKLTIITQTKDNDIALSLEIEWDKYHGDMDLVNVTNSIKEVQKTKGEGTTLIIDALRDRWSQASIKRIYRYVTAIIQPFQLTKGDDAPNIVEPEGAVSDPGFKIRFKKIEGGRAITIADETNMIYDHALAIIEGWIDDSGLGIYSIESKKLNLDEVGQIGADPDDNTIAFTKLKNVCFRAYYYVYQSDLIPKMQETSIKNLSRKIGGIRLYRNGFRVLPYGEPGNDWLKLDASIRKRSLLPVHGNINFFGFVEIKDDEKLFNETSSREGLMENEPLIQLQNFVYRTLLTGVIRTAEIRNVKIVSGQKKEGTRYEKIEVRIKDIAHTIEALDRELEKESGDIEVKKRRQKQLNKIKNDIKQIAELQKAEQTAFLKERSMLRVLGSVGLTIGQFIHEVRDYIINMESDIAFLLEKLQSDQVAMERVLILDRNVATFQTYTSYFDNVISQNVVRDLIPIELQNTAELFWKSIKSDAEKSGIEFLQPQRNGFFIFTIPMHPSEWSSILFNFYTNSKKAIKRSKLPGGKIMIECGFSENQIYLEFSDNGDGISEENEDRIFEEFFTTSIETYDKTDSNNEITGTGLGLKIVKDIVTSYRGNVQVVSAKDGFNTCLRVEIPKATNKELDKYGL